MLRIRLSRFGKKKQPTYRIIVSERARDPWGKALEYLGHYNPHTKVIEVKKDRILYWISKGAQPTPTVHNLLIDQNVIEAEKVKASKSKKKKKEAEKEGEPVAKLDEKKEEKKPEEIPTKKPKEDKDSKDESKKEKKEEKPKETKKEEKDKKSEDKK